MNEREALAELLPCPFCGAGDTSIVENGRVWAGLKWGEPSSVSIRHHCAPTPGQPSRMLERVGKDRPSAIAAWNTRAVLAQPDARWYCLSSDGLATLCANESDARATAAEADRDWPRGAPHRSVQLVEAAPPAPAQPPTPRAALDELAQIDQELFPEQWNPPTLTDEQIADLSLSFVNHEPLTDFDYVGFARAIERAVKGRL